MLAVRNVIKTSQDRQYCSSLLTSIRFVSSSPYGRTHVWRRRPPKLPNPVVPLFPQRVTLSDGSTFTHWTTSPRSTIRLTKDTTNTPLWNPWLESGEIEGEGGTTGRMGRFRRKFEDMGETGIELDDLMEGISDSTTSTSTDDAQQKSKCEIVASFCLSLYY